MAKRGIVITAPIVETQGGVIFTGDPLLRPEILRQYALYWDKIIHANLRNGFINIRMDPNNFEDDLKIAYQAGIFNSVEVSIKDEMGWNSSEYASLLVGAQQFVASNLNKRDGSAGSWAIGQSAKLQLPSEASTKKDVFVTQMRNALPVPASDISMERVLNFKNTYSDEFMAFRGAYDDLYLSAMNQGDQHTAMVRVVERLERSIRDVTVAMREQSLKPTGMSLKTLWRVPIDALKTFGAAMAVFPDIPLGIAALLGTTEAAMSMNVLSEQQPNDLPDRIKDYAYVGLVNTELRGME